MPRYKILAANGLFAGFLADVPDARKKTAKPAQYTAHQA